MLRSDSLLGLFDAVLYVCYVTTGGTRGYYVMSVHTLFYAMTIYTSDSFFKGFYFFFQSVNSQVNFIY